MQLDLNQQLRTESLSMVSTLAHHTRQGRNRRAGLRSQSLSLTQGYPPNFAYVIYEWSFSEEQNGKKNEPLIRVTSWRKAKSF